MADPVYVVSGATGNIGSEVVAGLLAAGKRVRALGRDSRKLSALGAQESLLGSLDDRMYVAKAMAGATAAFVMVPPNMASGDFRSYAKRVIEGTTAALAANQVQHVVALSSIGADLPDGTGPISTLHLLEERVRSVAAQVLCMRPCFFLENHLAAVPMVKGMGIYGTPLRPDLAMPMIATRDIGQTIARRLAAMDITGHEVAELHGAKDYTMVDVARSLGKEIGKPDLPYVQFPYEDAQRAMVGMGMSSDVAKLMVEMQRAFNEGVIKARQPRSRETTTPTTLGQFAKTFAAAYKARGG